MVDEPVLYARIGREYSECETWRRNTLRHIAMLRPDIAVVGSSSTYDFSQSQWKEGTARVLRSLSRSSRHVYLLRPTPLLPFDGPGCLAPRSWLHDALAGTDRCTVSARQAWGDAVYHSLQAAAAGIPNARTVDLTDLVSPSGQCRAELEGVIVFRDNQHLSVKFSRSLWGALAARLESENVR